jgi:hypothetical protein
MRSYASQVQEIATSEDLHLRSSTEDLGLTSHTLPLALRRIRVTTLSQWPHRDTHRNNMPPPRHKCRSTANHPQGGIVIREQGTPSEADMMVAKNKVGWWQHNEGRGDQGSCHQRGSNCDGRDMSQGRGSNKTYAPPWLPPRSHHGRWPRKVLQFAQRKPCPPLMEATMSSESLQLWMHVCALTLSTKPNNSFMSDQSVLALASTRSSSVGGFKIEKERQGVSFVFKIRLPSCRTTSTRGVCWWDP